jgi:hypothetical protein
MTMVLAPNKSRAQGTEHRAQNAEFEVDMPKQKTKRAR